MKTKLYTIILILSCIKDSVCLFCKDGVNYKNEFSGGYYDQECTEGETCVYYKISWIVVKDGDFIADNWMEERRCGSQLEICEDNDRFKTLSETIVKIVQGRDSPIEKVSTYCCSHKDLCNDENSLSRSKTQVFLNVDHSLLPNKNEDKKISKYVKKLKARNSTLIHKKVMSRRSKDSGANASQILSNFKISGIFVKGIASSSVTKSIAFVLILVNMLYIIM